MHSLRPFEDTDRAALVALMNHDRPPHRHSTVAAWARNDARRIPEEVYRRVVVGDPAIAFLGVLDLNTTPFKLADVCDMELFVAREHRRQGIGRLLYDHALEFAHERGARRLITHFREWTPDEPAIPFLTARRFAEQERERPSYLDLATFDPASFLPTIAQAESHGIHLLSYADVSDTEENRRRLYDLVVPLLYDIPRRDNQPFQAESFEDWIKMVVARPEWTPELYMLAEHAGEFVGMCHVVPKLEGTVAMQFLTGVIKDHRGKGIATALKARAYIAAKGRGRSVITTENHEDNAPMLAVNRKFGFQPEAPVVSYNKVLSEVQA